MDVEVVEDEMLKVLTDLTSKQRTFSSQKKQQNSQKIVEGGRAKLHRDSLAQVSKLKAKREAEGAKIKEIIEHAHEKIIEYNTRCDEFHLGVRSRLSMHIDSYTNLYSDLDAILTAFNTASKAATAHEIEMETTTVKDSLKGKMLQLEEKLHAIERQRAKERKTNM